MKKPQNSYVNSVNLNTDSNFPYLVLDVINDQSYPRNPGFQVMHWHEDLQFIYVLNGDIEIKTLDTCISLHKGEGIFINKNVIHFVHNVSTCHYNSFIFPDYFLKFYLGSPAGAVVERISGNKDVPIFLISLENDNRKVLRILQKLSELEQNQSPFYAYEVLVLLCSLWAELCKIIPLPEQRKSNHVTCERMADFLKYIELNYKEDISLANLAKSANVSKSECLRCFKASLQTTPYKYLTEYRLSKAEELLRTTGDPIGSIASQVGFQQVSHFGKCFREKTGVSPSKYRKLNQ